jgi:hypothetical protein
MPLLVPVLDQAHHEYTITLDEHNISLGFMWQDASASWFMQLKDNSGEIVQDYVKVLPEVPLARRGNIDFGEFNLFAVAVDRSNPDQIITRDNLGIGKEFQVTYATVNDVGSPWLIFLDALNGE